MEREKTSEELQRLAILSLVERALPGEAARAPARLRAPSVERAVARVRFGEALDRCQAPIVWVAAPAGAGKTVGVAGYLSARKLPFVWYQVDAQDRDPGTLIAALGGALTQHDVGQAVPQLAPVAPAARRQQAARLFTQLLAVPSAPFALVLDNFHEAESERDFLAIAGGLFDAWLATARAPARLLVTSRRRPPKSFARWVVNESVELLDPDLLRFDAAEMRQLLQRARTSGSPSSEDVAQVLERSGGWAAVAAIFARPNAAAPAAFSHDPARVLLDYVSSELFDQLSERHRAALSQLAFFSNIEQRQLDSLCPGLKLSELVAELERLGVPHALDERDNLRLHDLVRDVYRRTFLTRAAHCGARECETLVRELWDTDQVQDATQLAYDLGRHAVLAELVKRDAAMLMGFGRAASLGLALSRLPRELVAREPWLEFWSATLSFDRDFSAARGRLEQAFAAFVARGDQVGMSLAAARLAEAAMMVDGRESIDRWWTHLEVAGTALPAHAEARVLTLRLLLHHSRGNGGSAVQRAADRAMALLHGGLPPVDALTLCGAASIAYFTAGRLEDARLAIEKARQVAAFSKYDQLIKVVYLYGEAAYNLCVSGDALRALSLAEEAIAVTAPAVIPFMSGNVACTGLIAAVACGELARANALLALIEAQSASMSTNFMRARSLFSRACVAAARGDIPSALADLRARDACQASGVDQGMITTLITEACILLAERQFDAMREVLADLATMLQASQSPYFALDAQLLDALRVHAEHGPDSARAPLTAALTAMRVLGRRAGGLLTRSALTSLVGAAFELGIETELARDLAQWAHLYPPRSDLGPDWPWPVVVRTFGSIGLTVFATDESAHGPPSRLLLTLVGAGSESVAIDRLAPELWAGRAAKASRSAFDTALHRLRRQLGGESLLQLRRAALHLDRTRIWADTWALAELQRSVERGAAGAHLDAIESWGTRLLDIYRGPFCEGDTQASIVRARARFARMFVASVARLVERLRALGEPERASQLVETALDRHDTSEELHRLAIALFIERSLPGEAASALERCRSILRARLRVEPGRATEQLVPLEGR